MAETLTSTLKVVIDATLSKALDIGTGTQKVNTTYTTSLTNGTGANQANQMFTDTRTISASSSEDLDLSGVLASSFGTTLVFTSIKAIIVSAASANTNDVVIGGAAANDFSTFFGASTDTIIVVPGGTFALINPEANGYAVTAGSADLLKIANSSSGTSVVYDIIIIGEV